MCKTFMRLLILGFCGWLATTSAAGSLRVATEGAYPPFSFINEEGQLAGFDVDIAREICRRLEKDCEIVAVPWNELLSRLMAGQHQMIVASMSKTLEREQQAEFTDPYYRTRNVFIGRRDVGVTQVNRSTKPPRSPTSRSARAISSCGTPSTPRCAKSGSTALITGSTPATSRSMFTSATEVCGNLRK